MIKNLSKNEIKYDKLNSKLKIAIVRSTYHDKLTKNLEEECKKYLISAGVLEKYINTFEVPGSWEIPLIANALAKSKKIDGLVAFGIILKGETYHFELIAKESARALMNIALDYNTPVVFEILSVYSLKQAKIRCMGEYNKGMEAAQTVLKTIRQLSKV